SRISLFISAARRGLCSDAFAGYQGPIACRIQSSLQSSSELRPTHLKIINESAGHAVADRHRAETHFKVLIVSNQFDGVSVVNRHRLVNKVLASYLGGSSSSGRGGIHALSIDARTPDEWLKEAEVSGSPPCMGGERKQN
ncbi:hypothetical protein BOX15_Mlig003503g1, partial [Macrostomum lignano]